MYEQNTQDWVTCTDMDRWFTSFFTRNPIASKSSPQCHHHCELQTGGSLMQEERPKATALQQSSSTFPAAHPCLLSQQQQPANWRISSWEIEWGHSSIRASWRAYATYMFLQSLLYALKGIRPVFPPSFLSSLLNLLDTFPFFAFLKKDVPTSKINSIKDRT